MHDHHALALQQRGHRDAAVVCGGEVAGRHHGRAVGGGRRVAAQQVVHLVQGERDRAHALRQRRVRNVAVMQRGHATHGGPGGGARAVWAKGPAAVQRRRLPWAPPRGAVEGEKGAAPRKRTPLVMRKDEEGYGEREL